MPIPSWNVWRPEKKAFLLGESCRQMLTFPVGEYIFILYVGYKPFLWLFMKKNSKLTIKSLALFCLFLAFPASATHVAVLETTSAKDVLTLEEKQYLTDVLRSEAVKALPAEQNYTIMTRENISVMLPPGKAVEDCEGSCLVETGKNIAADFVAQGHVGRFANNLTITVELYETAGNKLMGSFSTKAPDIESLEVEIRQKSNGLFSRIVASSSGTLDLQPVLAEKVGHEAELVIKIDGESKRDGRKFMRGTWEMSPGIHEVEFVHRCYEPQKFKVKVQSGRTTTVNNSLDAIMGSFSLTTEYKGAFREVPVFVNGVMAGRTPFTGRAPICAKVEVGEEEFRETVVMSWNDKDKLEITHSLKNAKPTAEELRADSIANATRLAEQQAAEDAARAAAAKEKRSAIAKPVSIAMMVLGLAGVGVGIYENSVGNDERKKYDEASFDNEDDFKKQWDKVESAKTMRNVFYGIGGALIGAGAIVFFVF